MQPIVAYIITRKYGIVEMFCADCARTPPDAARRLTASQASTVPASCVQCRRVFAHGAWITPSPQKREIVPGDN
jgi:hypothetical protein